MAIPRVFLVWVAAAAIAAPNEIGPGAQAAEPEHEWVFDTAHVRDGRVQASAGGTEGTLVGKLSLGSKPDSLVFTGDLKSRLAVEIAADGARIPLPKRELTVEAWVQVVRTQEWGGIVSALQDNGSFEKGWLLGFQANRFSFAVAARQAKARKLTYLQARTEFQPGCWYYVAGTYDGTEQRIYVDGRLAASSREQAGDIDYAPKFPLVLGAYRDDDEWYPLAGRLARARVLGRALSAEEIAGRFDSLKSGFPGIEAAALPVEDWPTYLRDGRRRGITDEPLAFPLRLHWSYRTRRPPRPSWPEEAKADYFHQRYGWNARVTFDCAFHLVGAGDRVLFGSSAEDRVVCLDAATGRENWRFLAEGPVRLAPTIAGDRVLFGSDDGHVYCLSVQDGRMLWKYRIGPSDRRIPGNERMISQWPVRTDVLVERGRAYAFAGVFPSQGGVFQAELDLDGRLIEKRPLSATAQGYLERRSGSLFVFTGRDPAGAFARDWRRGDKELDREVNLFSGEYPFAYIGAADTRIAGGDGRLAAFRLADRSRLWSANVEGRVYSLAVLRGRLLASTDQGCIYCYRNGDNPPGASPALVRNEQPAPPDFPYPDPRTRERYQAVAESIVRQAATPRGYALVLGAGEGALCHELASRTEWQILGVEPDAAKAAELRRRLDRAGWSGRVSIQHHALAPLPYGDCLFNVVTADAVAGGGSLTGSRDEAFRVLRPEGGLAWLGPAETDRRHRGPLPGAGEWTHFYGDAANTACSRDGRAGASFALQWFGPPGPRRMLDRHHRPAAPLVHRGRMFLGGEDLITAVDAYNGTILWERPMVESSRVIAFRDCGPMAVTDDGLYVAAGRRCAVLDVDSGRVVRELPLPPAGQEGAKYEWGYVALVGDSLLGSGVKAGSIRRGQSHVATVTETHWDFVPVVGSDFLFASDHHGKTRWVYQARHGLILNPTLAAEGGTLFFLESDNPQTLANSPARARLGELLGQGATLTALDLATGQARWQRAGRDFAHLQHNVYLAASGGRLVAVGTRNTGPNRETDRVVYEIQVFDAATGRPLWSQTQVHSDKINGEHGEQDRHPVLVGGALYCEPRAYDLATGRPLDWGWPWSKPRRGCGTLSASATCLYFRQETAALFDLVNRRTLRLTTETRPGCWINLIPACGMLLAPEASSGCTCNFPIQTSLGLIATGPPAEQTRP